MLRIVFSSSDYRRSTRSWGLKRRFCETSTSGHTVVAVAVLKVCWPCSLVLREDSACRMPQPSARITIEPHVAFASLPRKSPACSVHLQLHVCMSMAGCATMSHMMTTLVCTRACSHCIHERDSSADSAQATAYMQLAWLHWRHRASGSLRLWRKRTRW